MVNDKMKDQKYETTGRMLKSKYNRTDRRTFRLRFSWEMLIHVLDKPISLERCK